MMEEVLAGPEAQRLDQHFTPQDACALKQEAARSVGARAGMSRAALLVADEAHTARLSLGYRRAKAPPDSLHTLSPRVPWRRPRVRSFRPSSHVTVSVPPRLDLLSQSRPPGRAFARLGRSGRTWQRRLFTNSPLEPPTGYSPHPLNARNLHTRLSLAHRLRFTLSPVQRTRSGWLLPPTSSAPRPSPAMAAKARHLWRGSATTDVLAYFVLVLRLPKIK